MSARVTVPASDYERVIAWRDSVWLEIDGAATGWTRGCPPIDVERTMSAWLEAAAEFGPVHVWTVQPDDGSGRWAIGPEKWRDYASGRDSFWFSG